MFESEEVVPVDPALCWHVVKVGQEVPIRGFVAGPVQVQTCHQFGKVSKPCWSRITKGQLDCPRCAEKAARRQIGYLPLFDSLSLKQLVVIVSKTMVPVAQAVPLHGLVSCIMPKVKGLPMRVAPEQDVGGHSLQRRQLAGRPAQDIRRYLLKLWGVPELVEFFHGE